MRLVIAVDDPRAPDVQALLEAHLAFARMEVFAPARSLYAKAGFEPCGPFGDYGHSPNSVYMTINLEPAARTTSHES